MTKKIRLMLIVFALFFSFIAASGMDGTMTASNIYIVILCALLCVMGALFVTLLERI